MKKEEEEENLTVRINNFYRDYQGYLIQMEIVYRFQLIGAVPYFTKYNFFCNVHQAES